MAAHRIADVLVDWGIGLAAQLMPPGVGFASMRVVLDAEALMPAPTSATLVLLLSAATTAGVLAILVPILRKYVLDRPNERSSHTVPTPRGGGIGVVAGVVAGALLCSALAQPRAGALALAAVVLGLGVLGFAEDKRGLRVRTRLVGQALIPALVIAASVWRGELSVWWALPWMAAAVFVVNAANFMDGVNGISGAHGTLAGAYAMVVGSVLGRPELALAGLVVAGAFGAFLPFNVPRARVFLGDVGSYALGAVQWGLAFWAALVGAPLAVAAAPVAIYAVDVISTLIRRARRGVRLTEAHHEHTYQQVQEMTHTHALPTLVPLAATAVCCLGGFLGLQRGSPWLIPLLADAVAAVAYLLAPRVVRRLRGSA